MKAPSGSRASHPGVQAQHAAPAAAQPASSEMHIGSLASPNQPRRSGRVGKPAGKLTDPEGGGLASKPRKSAPAQPRKRPLLGQKSKLGPSGKSTPALPAQQAALGKTAIPRASKVEAGTYVPQLPVQLTCSESEAVSHSTSLGGFADSQPSGSQQPIIDLAEDSEADEGTDEPRMRSTAASDSACSPSAVEPGARHAGRRHQPDSQPTAAAMARPRFGGRPSVLDSMWPEEEDVPEPAPADAYASWEQEAMPTVRPSHALWSWWTRLPVEPHAARLKAGCPRESSCPGHSIYARPLPIFRP